jgi:hypothetical protein
MELFDPCGQFSRSGFDRFQYHNRFLFPAEFPFPVKKRPDPIQNSCTGGEMFSDNRLGNFLRFSAIWRSDVNQVRFHKPIRRKEFSNAFILSRPVLIR